MDKNTIKFPEPFDEGFSWTDEKVLPKPEEVTPDFSWTDERDFDAEKNARNPHEIKDELASQWNKGKIPYTPENNSTKDMLKTASRDSIVKQVRTMMNQGYTASVIRERLAKSQKPEILSYFKADIDKQLKLYGSVGKFVIDARGYGSCSEALQVAAKNPNKKYLAYVIGCQCGTPKQVFRVASESFSPENGDEDSLHAFLTGGQMQSETVPVCPTTGTHILSGEGDIDEQWAGNTMFDAINASHLSKEAGKSFIASNDSPYQKLKKFFIALDENEIPKEQDFSEAPVTEAYTPAGMTLGLENDSPASDVDLNQEDSISFFIPETQNQDIDVTLKEGNTIQLPEEKAKENLQMIHGVAPVEFEIADSEPIDVALCEDGISFLPNEEPKEAPMLLELGEVDPEIEFNDDQNLDIGFENESKGGNDIVL